MKVLSRHWLRCNLIVQLDLRDWLGRHETIKMGDVLVDKRGCEFLVAGLQHVRYLTIEDARAHRHEVSLLLKPLDTHHHDEPVGRVTRKPL